MNVGAMSALCCAAKDRPRSISCWRWLRRCLICRPSAAALARGALDGEETMVAILPPRPARALLAAAEAWAAEHGAALSFGLTTVSDAFSGLPPGDGRAGLPHPRRGPVCGLAALVPTLLGIALLALAAGMLWGGQGTVGKACCCWAWR